MKDPRSHFTRGIAEAVENTPEFEAMFSYSQIIPNTWGNLASQLVADGHVEPTLEAACNFLGIQPEDINDPTLLGTTHSGSFDHASLMNNRLCDRWVKEYETAHEQDDVDFFAYIDSCVDEWRLPDAEEQAEALQEEIDDLSELEAEANKQARAIYIKMDPGTRMPLRNQIYDEADRLENAVALLELRHEALSSGIAIQLTDFATRVLTYEGINKPDDARLVLALGEIADDLYQNGYGISQETRLNELTIGEEAILDFKRVLELQQRQAAKHYANAKWKVVEYLFYAGDYQDHPLFSGIHAQ